MFGSVLVANRGEIAVRVMRTLRRMGIRAVAVYSDADADAAHVLDADLAVHLGPAPAAESYLSVERVVAAAVRSGADAIHPGYGFLAENVALAEACADAGLVWIGPPPAAIEAMGDKINAKRTVAAAGVPVVPGRDEPGLSDTELADAALAVGLPVLLKPSAGGGGKGMRRVDAAADLPEAIAAARREAMGAFGDDTLLVERFVPRPRHIEVQVFADTHGNTIHLGERECSLQRRHQKIVEESPSALVDPELREAMGASAVDAARACGYVGAGTVELLVSANRPDEYFFMEMNTRLQVEHPVTEMVTGLDLVEWQLRVAAGERLPLSQDQVRFRGHAVEARVYAEDTARGFLPASGPVLLVASASDPQVRVDSGLRAGTQVTTYYDPLLAKVVAWGSGRSEALARLDATLAGTTILGVTTNVAFLRRLLALPEIMAADLDTELVERRADALAAPVPPDGVVAAAGLLLLATTSPTGTDPWDAPGGWRVGAPAPTVVELRLGSDPYTVSVTGPVSDAVVRVGGCDAVLAALELTGDTAGFTWDGVRRSFRWAADGSTCWLGSEGQAWVIRPAAREAGIGAGAGRAGPVSSPMPGTVLAVHVSAGDGVSAGQALFSVEAMKMEHTVRAPLDATVAEVRVHAGQQVALDQTLAVLAARDQA